MENYIAAVVGQMEAAYEVSMDGLDVMLDGGFTPADIRKRMHICWNLGTRLEGIGLQPWTAERRELFKRANLQHSPNE